MLKYFIITFLLLSCSSAPVINSAPVTDGKIRISHDVSYRNKGSRSESRSGYLTIDGIILPDCFTLVVVDGKSYMFLQRKQRWGNDGYFPSEDKKYSPVRKIDKSMTDSDIARGWCNSEGIMKNMPNGWIFVKWENGSAVVMPSKIPVLIAEKKIKPLPRFILGRT
ncbi:MAG: hypothetical protein KA982_08230 [Clostridia bacterium]|nr:hypothetical protein [Clostridia bacterium]